MAITQIKPTHKAILSYYAELKGYDAQGVSHEGAVSSAFQNLLAATGQERKWTLINQLAQKVGGKTIRPDGTMRDDSRFPRGYWEAKDKGDDLDVEIRKKINLGYPLTNTIFEDTRVAVLYQNGTEALRVLLSEPAKLADLLTAFYSYVSPRYEKFGEAVAAFKDRIPELAEGLNEKLALAHQKNKKFIAAFADFFTLCQTSLNPNIRVEAVDEMLVQHLLTERLFRTIFQNADFTRRNVIAAEIENVIDALTSGSFSRAEFLKSLDMFYLAIEDAADEIQDFGQKQHFLNTVYERFFQGYSVKVADTHGIVYTPQEIVDFMCASVEEVLRTEFGKGLGDEGVTILDPCTGTGNFIVNLMRRIPKKDLPRAYKEQLFANEVMLLPYYIASMNIEHEYYELTGTYEPFEGLCFVDTLELAEGQQRQLSFMSERNTERVERQKKAPITIVIGNPPYNVGQINECDNNKNRKYSVIDRRIRETYAKDSSATSKSKLSDMFVSFFRWATDRLENRDGIVAFVSNNSFFQANTFDGMRKHLQNDFDYIYHFDTRGNKRLIGDRQTRDGRNVFDDMVRVGVGITLLIRRRSERAESGCIIRYHAVGDRMKTREKLAYLSKFLNVSVVQWLGLTPDSKHSWVVPENEGMFSAFLPFGRRGTRSMNLGEALAISKIHLLGIMTSRDEIVFAFDRDSLRDRIVGFIERYNSEVDRFKRSGGSKDVDEFVNYDDLKWSRHLKQDLARGNYAKFDESKFRMSLYRPFCKKHLFYDKILNEEMRPFYLVFPDKLAGVENYIIVISDIGFRCAHFNALMTNRIADLHLTASSDAHQCFPFYTYNEDGTNRRENITDWALNQFREHYQDPKITKWDIFHYVYGVLHQPEYRTTFADNLKRELPRIPFMADFGAFAEAGRALAKWHLEYESVEPWPLTWAYAPGVPLSYEVAKMKLSKDKATLVVNDSLTLADIPPEVARYRLGNRSALEWVVDQYQVSEDARSGIRSDPNRADDPEYIVRLVGQVVRVSVETVRIVEGLPAGLGIGLGVE